VVAYLHKLWAAGAVFLFFSFSAHAAEKIALQLKWYSSFQFAGYYAALEKGFYAEEGLDVIIRERDSRLNPVDQVVAGEAQFGISDSSLVLHRLQGKPVVVLAAVFNHSPLVLLTREEDGILGPSDLKGRRVMLLKGIDDAALTAMFHQAGLEDADITHVPHTFDDMALLSHEVDAMSAYLTDQTFLYEKRGIPLRILNPINYGVDFYGDMLFTSQDVMERSPELAAKFRRASLKGWDYALKNKEEVITWLVTKYGSKKSVDHLRFEADKTEQMIQPHLIEIGSFSVSRLHWIANIYRHEGLAPKNSDLGAIDYLEYQEGKAAFLPWFKWLTFAATLSFALILVLAGLNRRLSRLVELRTAELKSTRDRLQEYVDTVDRYVITSSTTLSGRITYASDAFVKISGYSKEELVGRAHNIVRHSDMPKEIYKAMWDVLKRGESWHGELKNRAKDGSSYWVDVNISPIFDDDKTITGYTAIRHDITDKKRIEKLSVTDRLTGLFNRMKLDHTLLEEIARKYRYGHALSVVLLDLDHFKLVNDLHGHNVGDAVLVEMARLIRENVRHLDVEGRWGGEEFLVVCLETDLLGAQALAEKIRESVEANAFPSELKKTVSIGVATAIPDDTPDSLIKRADDALYQAKRTGRNRVCVGA